MASCVCRTFGDGSRVAFFRGVLPRIEFPFEELVFIDIIISVAFEAVVNIGVQHVATLPTDALPFAIRTG